MTMPRFLAPMLVLLALSLSGCAGTGLFGGNAPPTNAQEQAAMQAKADEAWQAGKMERALTLYGYILQGQALTREARLTAMERQARAALSLGRAPEALDALDNWAQTDSKAKTTWPWTELYIRALSDTGRERQAEEHLAKLLQQKGASFDLTGHSGLELARRYAYRNQAAQASQMLRTQHAKAPNRTARSLFEADTARMLGALEPKALGSMLSTVNDANRSVFPYCLIAFEDLRRTALHNPSDAPRLRELAQKLSQRSDLADRGLPGRIASQGLAVATADGADTSAPPLAEKDLEPVQTGTVAVALLLPQTGQLRGLASKVLAGANAAKTVLAAQGVQVDIRVINTDDPNFVDQLTALPHEVTLVGGPMHASYFKNLPASGELSRRVFLTFMPELAEAEEGKQAWRFFWSPQDEVNAVLNLPMEEGLRRFGVLYPDDRMGKRLADAFGNAVANRGGEVTSIQAYPPQEAAKWGEIVRAMVKATPKGTDGKSFNIRPDFQAIFIPDALQSADHMIGQLAFYGADSLIILGPQLWAETLSAPGAKPNITPANYRFAFCSGSWWPQSPSKAVGALKAQLTKDRQGDADFWSALGFDFVRLAAGAGAMPVDVLPSEVTRRLNEAAAKQDWALSPVSWDGAGKARMALHFLRPSVEGLAPVDKDGFHERLEAIQNRQAGVQPTPQAPQTQQPPQAQQPFAQQVQPRQ